jgi:hypothetical protein
MMALSTPRRLDALRGHLTRTLAGIRVNIGSYRASPGAGTGQQRAPTGQQRAPTGRHGASTGRHGASPGAATRVEFGNALR